MSQIIAIGIFLLMFILIIMDKFKRHYITLGCGALTIIFVFCLCMRNLGAVWGALNLRTIFTTGFWYTAGNEVESSSGINWSTIIFIGGMMVMVEGMARVGFFRWLCMRLAKMVRYKAISLFISFMVMSFILAMFIDSITVILFLAAVTIELSQLLKFDPIPMVLAEIFCANLGGSATMCGDPPNIIIGTSLGYSFFDFIHNTGGMALISLVAIVIFFYFTFRKEFKKNGDIDINTLPSPASTITDKTGFGISVVIFLIAVVLLVTHAMTGFTVALIGVAIALLTIITSGKHALEVIKKVDYETLLFFVGLFLVVDGLEQTGVLELIAKFIGDVCGGNAILMVSIIIWISAAASAFVDNIPFAATMIPVIRTLSATQGMDLSVLAWSLSMGTDIGGSATPIGASANVVGISTAAKEGHHISWKYYCKKAVPATVIVLLICNIFIVLRYL